MSGPHGAQKKDPELIPTDSILPPKENEAEPILGYLCALCQAEMLVPRLLSCFHTFCVNCVAKHQLSNFNIHCPLCDHVTVSEPHLLPKNRVMASIRSNWNCGCDNCAERNASVYCTDCLASLCENCHTFLHRNPVLRHHRLKPLPFRSLVQPNTDLPLLTPMDLCHRHMMENIFFCVPCQIWICEVCCDPKTNEPHSNHEVFDIQQALDARAALLSRVSRATQEIEKWQHNLTKSIDTTNDSLLQIEASRERAVHHINAFMGHLMKAIQDKQSQLVEQVERNARLMIEPLIERQRMLDRCKDHIKDTNAFLSPMIKFPEILDLDVNALCKKKFTTSSARYLLQMDAWATSYCERWQAILSDALVEPSTTFEPTVFLTFPVDAIESILRNLGDMVHTLRRVRFSYRQQNSPSHDSIVAHQTAAIQDPVHAAIQSKDPTTEDLQCPLYVPAYNPFADTASHHSVHTAVESSASASQRGLCKSPVFPCGLWAYLSRDCQGNVHRHPTERGVLTVRASSVGFGNPETLFGTSMAAFSTMSESQAWVSFELNTDMAVFVEGYSLAYNLNEGDVHFLRSWSIEAWSPFKREYVVLRAHMNDTTLDANTPCAYWPIQEERRTETSTTEECVKEENVALQHSHADLFRRFRIVMQGPTSSNTHYLMLAGIELYGTLYEGYVSPLPNEGAVCSSGHTKTMYEAHETIHRTQPR